MHSVFLNILYVLVHSGYLNMHKWGNVTKPGHNCRYKYVHTHLKDLASSYFLIQRGPKILSNVSIVEIKHSDTEKVL